MQITVHTMPNRADTDRDGYADSVDRLPLGDAFVEVRIDSAYVSGVDSHNPGEEPYPFVKASLLGNETYTMYLSGPSGSWYTVWDGEILWGHRLAVNVPDDAASVDVAFAMWSYDSSGSDQHVPIGIGQAWDREEGSCLSVYSVTLSYALGGPGSSTAYKLWGCSLGLSARPLIVTLTTIVPDRVDTRLLLPADYAGVYNVTDASGSVVGRRYVGEPRFVAVVFNGTTSKAVLLVLRSVFFDTRMYADLQDPSRLGQLPYMDPSTGQEKMKGYRNGTTSSNSDVLQMVYAFDGLPDAYLETILALLLGNASGVADKVYLTWTASDWSLLGSPYLLGLPDEAIQAVPTRPLSHSPSHPEYLSQPATEIPWWEKLWRGFVEALNVVLEWVRSAVVWVANLVRDFVQVLVNFGSWLADLTSGDPVRVANAVRAAAQVLGQVVKLCSLPPICLTSSLSSSRQ